MIAQIDKIAFIGLGNMGFPMAGHLAKAGYTVAVHDGDPEKTRSHASEFATEPAATATEAVAGCSVLITMLPDIRVVKSVLQDIEGQLEQKTVSLFIDMSSSDPVETRSLGQSLASKKIAMIDAPVSGGVARALTGELAIMAGGDETTFKRAEPFLKTMGQNIFHVGPLGCGQAMKALNNLASATGLLIASEVITSAQKFGIDAEMAVDVLNKSTGRNNSTETKFKQQILSKKFASGFAMNLMAKDLQAAINLTNHVDADARLGEKSLELWKLALEQLGNHPDHTDIARWIAENSTKDEKS